MIKSILKYAGKYKILTVVATVMVAIAVAAQILPYIFAYQIISPLIAGESIPWQFAVGRVVGVAVCLVLNFVFYLGGLSLSHIAAFNTLYNLRVSLQGKMEKLPLGVVQEKGTGNLKKLFVDAAVSASGSVKCASVLIVYKMGLGGFLPAFSCAELFCL